MVTFEDRVIFSDRDMGGDVSIAPGMQRVHITFSRPYSETPVITITPVDHTISAYVSGLSRSGFDIEIQSPVSQNL